jgi:hypothetical protein
VNLNLLGLRFQVQGAGGQQAEDEEFKWLKELETEFF